jgi:2-iminobutanoate/2-iminopropanoate deaminase
MIFAQASKMVSIIVVMSLVVFGCATNAVQKEVIATKKAPEAIGPYSQAVKFGNLLFLAGQIAIDPKTNQLMKDASIEDQTRLVLNNLKAVLEENGMTMDNALSTTVFLKDLNDFAKMNAVYAEFFKSAPPARATVEVARLPRDVKVEIALIAGK